MDMKVLFEVYLGQIARQCQQNSVRHLAHDMYWQPPSFSMSTLHLGHFLVRITINFILTSWWYAWFCHPSTRRQGTV